MKELDQETAKKLQELQLAEQGFQAFFLQKQSLQLELSEVNSALEQVKATKDEVYKIVGQVMLRTKKDELVKELGSRKELLELRIKTLEKQEQTMKERLAKLREEVMRKIK